MEFVENDNISESSNTAATTTAQSAMITYPNCLLSINPPIIRPVTSVQEFDYHSFKEFPLGNRRVILVFKDQKLYNVYEEKPIKENHKKSKKRTNRPEVSKKLKERIAETIKDIRIPESGFYAFVAVLTNNNIIFIDTYIENDYKLLSHTWQERLNILNKYKFDTNNVIFLNDRPELIGKNAYKNSSCIRSLTEEHINYTHDYTPVQEVKLLTYMCVGVCMYNITRPKTFHLNKRYRFNDYEMVYDQIVNFIRSKDKSVEFDPDAFDLSDPVSREDFAKHLNTYKDIMINMEGNDKTSITLSYKWSERMYLIAGKDGSGALKLFTFCRKVTNMDAVEDEENMTVETNLDLIQNDILHVNEDMVPYMDKVRYFPRMYMVVSKSKMFNEKDIMDTCEIKRCYSFDDIYVFTNNTYMVKPEMESIYESINRCNEFVNNRHLADFIKAFNTLKELLLLSRSEDDAENKKMIDLCDDIYEFGYRKLETKRVNKRKMSDDCDRGNAKLKKQDQGQTDME